MLGTTDSYLSVVQINLQRKKTATHELLMEADKRKLSIALTQEPYVGSEGMMKKHIGTTVVQAIKGGEKTSKSAIVVFDARLDVSWDPFLLTSNITYVVATLGTRKIAFFSVYFEGTEPIEPYLQTLHCMCEKIKADHYIIGGDMNAWSSWWGSKTDDARGRLCKDSSVIWTSIF